MKEGMMARVLVVDDDELFRSMLTEMVGREGHQVSTATNGHEALKAVSLQRPDVVITDILMPEKDGIELIMELAQLGARIPVIAVSGGRRAISSDFNLESARLLGVCATLGKPFSREALRQALQQALMH